MENRQELKFTPCLKQPDPAIFWRNFIKTALISIIIDTLGMQGAGK